MGMVLAIYAPIIMMTQHCNGHGPGSLCTKYNDDTALQWHGPGYLCTNYNDDTALQWTWSWLFMY